MVKTRIFVRFVLLLGAMLATGNVWAAKPPEGSVVRTLTLADLDVSERVSLGNRHHEQHFYFPVPQDVAVKDARIQIHGFYHHPFAEAAAITVVVNGTPVFSRRLSSGNGGLFLKMVDLEGAMFSRGRSDEQGEEIDISLPLRKLRAAGGFVDIGIVLSRQTDATRCIEETGRGNEFSIDAKSTRLTYAFDADAVRNIRDLLATLPRHPLIWLPQPDLTPVQYAAAVRLSQTLFGFGFKPAFVTMPKVGDLIETEMLGDVTGSSGVRVPADMAAAIASGQPYKIQKPEEISAWLALRMMSQEGLAQIVIDAEQSKRVLVNALHQLDDAAGKRAAEGLRLDEAEQWLGKGGLDNSNIRIAVLAGRPVLVLEGGEIGKAIDLLATQWRQTAGSRELVMATAQPVADQDSDLPHMHFASNLPVLNVSDTAEWLVPIQYGHLPQGKWPAALELNLMAAPGGDGFAPVVSVFMNDNLLTAKALRTDGDMTRVTANIPQYALRANNQLRVEIRRRLSGGHCSGAAQGFPVQLLPSSYLLLRDDQAPTQFFMFGAEFGHDGEIAVPASYLQDAPGTLPVVTTVLRGLSIGDADFKLRVGAQPGFAPDRSFVAFGAVPDAKATRVSITGGRLLVRNRRDHAVFDSVGLGNLTVLQLLESGKHHGVSVTTVDGALPELRQPLVLSSGNLAMADAGGVRLEINLEDPENDWLLDEQNRGVMAFTQRYRIWLMIVGALLFAVLVVLGLRQYYRGRPLNA